MSHTPDPKTLTEAVNLGKGYGIDTAETILALAISKAIETPNTNSPFGVIAEIKKQFKAECAAYKSQLNKPVTECDVCSSKLDEDGECYKCLREWAMSQSG